MNVAVLTYDKTALMFDATNVTDMDMSPENVEIMCL